MKRFIMLFVFLITTVPCALANETIKADLKPNKAYLVLINAPAVSVCSSNEKVLKAEILTSIYNEKDKILLKITGNGKARIYIETDKDTAEFEVNVTAKEALPKDLGTIIKDIISIDELKSNSKPDSPAILNEPKSEVRIDD